MRIGVLICILILATVAGVLLHQDPGYALFAYKQWTMEMPLWLAVLGILAFIMLTVLLFSLGHAFSDTIHHLKEIWHYRHIKMSRRHTDQGLIELAEGRWHNAERFLIKGARYSDTPLINYLSAAKAAEERGSINRRDKYLQWASKLSEGASLAVGLTQAQLQFKEGQWNQSRDILEKLYQQEPHNVQILKYLSRVYEAQGDYQALLKLLPLLRKNQVMRPESLDQLELKAYQTLLPKRMHTGTQGEGIQDTLVFWKKLPRHLRNNSVLLAEYCSLLINQGLHSEADHLLKEALKKGLDNHLIYLYGVIKHDPKKQLVFAESFLEENADNSVLLLTLGKLAFAHQLWGKARDYLEKSIALKPSPEAYQTLARVYDHMGLTEKQNQCYKNGLFCATEVPVFFESLIS
jgi:HemY protein